ncbi:TPA: peptide deformylase [Candidatus Galligastranaerophilus gallistercoris]|nr:peptide deformylase [Candidatus Galligastranaerophilus gallistercoris]
MAILKIVTYGNESLRQKSKEISKISKKIRILAENMIDTMYKNNGVGLAAPQVGENIRMFVIDVSLDNEPYNPIVFINPKIIKKEGATHEKEGCLSFPNAFVDVRRYSYVKVKALDINGKPFIMEAKDGSLLSRAIQHEYDHLEGILFIDHSRNIFEAIKVLEENNLPTVQKDKMLDEKDIEDLLSNEDNKADNNE